MINQPILFITIMFCCVHIARCRDEDKIMKACYWPNEVYEACFGGCAEVSCDNPRSHLRPCYPYCEPGCVCEEPYVRDDRTHQCVLPQDCSPTQMGIPVTVRRADKNSYLNMIPKMAGRSPASQRIQHKEVEDIPTEFQDSPDALPTPPPSSNRMDISKRTADMSRMGNYFNIVIAPPPIKSIQPRKVHSSYNPIMKRLVS